MAGYDEQIAQLEEELKNTKYNKRTQGHIGLIKAKIAKLKEKNASRGKSSVSEGFSVKKSGNATVALLGFPSVGKSTLLNALTNAESKTAAYAFTTVSVIPGTLEHKNAKIQMLDLPGIIKGASKGSGRGREVISVLRQADLIMFLLDPRDAETQLKVLEKEVYDSGIRIGKSMPDVKITKEAKGGITIYRTVSTDIDDNTIKNILREFKMPNATIIIRENIGIDEFIDVIENNKIYTESLSIITKIDSVSRQEAEKNAKKIGADAIVSAQKRINIESLKDKIFSKLGFYRIYLKEIGKKPDMEIPLIIRSPCTVKGVCEKLHRDFISKFKYAKIWGSSKFPGQKASLEYRLRDKDIVEIHLS